jgi:hypothetical protein
VLKLRDRFIVLEAGKSALASLSGARCFSAGPNSRQRKKYGAPALSSMFNSFPSMAELSQEKFGHSLR